MRQGFHRESGQTTIFMMLALSIFFLAFLGFAVDFSNLWFHRQTAQAAADAACQAGAMDMLANANGGSGFGGFTPGTAFDCAANPTYAPCQYAALNGYTSSTLAPGIEGVSVTGSFPASLPGISTTGGGLSLPMNSFLRIDVTDRAPVYFSSLLTQQRTVDVVAFAACGLQIATAPIPIIVLHPTAQDALDVFGTPTINIIGGPQKSIQVNSSNATRSVNVQGSATVDLHLGGPASTGSDLGTFGAPTTAPGGFIPGSTGHWLAPSSPISDPFATYAVPSVPAAAPAKTTVLYNQMGCPDPDGCDRYQAGYYSSQLQVKNKTAIFDPGFYYIVGGLDLAANSTVRPSTNAGDGSGGTTFYFSGNSSVAVASNSGNKARLVSCCPASPNNSIAAFDTTTGGATGLGVQCPGGPVSPGVPQFVDGNILLGPCTGTYGDPAGQYRGMLFFQDRAAVGANANWGGGGQFLLAGNMYFHHCNASGTGTGCLAPPTGYDAEFTLMGNSGSGTYVLGNIVADNLSLGGTSAINMQLNPNAVFYILKVALLR